MAQILSQRTVVRGRWHNMGSDLCFWRHTFWLVHARTSAHADGFIVLRRSSGVLR